MIKKLILIAAMGAVGLLWGSGDVTIQVINAVKEKSITDEFDKKLAKSGLPIHKMVEGGRYIVTLGTFKDEKAAAAALKKARKIVDAGAFIRLVKRDQVAIAKVETHHESKEVVAVIEPRVEHVVVEVKPVVIEVKNTPVSVVSIVSSENKKEAHQNEIAEAISYYRNSPYYRFEPVMMQP